MPDEQSGSPLLPYHYQECTGNEPDEIKQLIRNWGDAIAQIKSLEETNDSIKSDLSDAGKSRAAIAHDFKNLSAIAFNRI